MKKMSIGLKIMLWFTLVVTIIVLITYGIIFSIEYNIVHKGIKDTLIHTVQNNLDEFEYYKSTDNMQINKVNHIINYEKGFLEISATFLQNSNEVYTALYKEDRTLIYGENPISKEVSSLKFTDSVIQEIKVDGTIYYIFDKKIPLDGVDNLWLRGIVSEEQGNKQVESIVRVSLIIFPLIICFSLIGGYIIVKKMLKPVHEISTTAKQIGKDGELKKRIDIGNGNDELHELASSFNEMLDKLEDSFLKQQQFTSDASHELRTPLSVILAQAQLSLELNKTQDEYKKDFEIIARQSKNMSKLINDMLDFSRLEMQSEKYKKEKINLSKVISSICADLKLIKDKNITLSDEIQQDLYINGNYELLTRLVTNLINNAYKYGKQNGNIFVSLKNTKNEIILLVEDDGIGIKKEDQEKIFDRFYQVDSSHSKEGSGLGLSMVSEIVQFHNGKIKVESELEKGSKFYIFFSKI